MSKGPAWLSGPEINRIPRCTSLITAGMEKGLHIGAQVCIRHNGETVADFATGLANQDHPLRRDHRMLWLSAGKPLTAVAVAQQVQAGKLSFEDPVVKHLPEFAEHGKEDVLLRHLLTHTHAYQPPSLDWPRMAWSDVISRICAARIPPGRTPGDYAAYDAQTTWYLLAEILQRMQDTAYHLVVQRDVLEPVGCLNSSLGMPAAEFDWGVNIDEIARLHDMGGPQAHPWTGDDALRAEAHNPGGGAVGPVRELALFYENLLNVWHGSGNQQWLSQPILQHMTARQREGLRDESFKQVVDWGYGFLINSAKYGLVAPYGYGAHASADTFGHGGMQSTSAYCDPENNLVVAVTWNGLPGEAKHNKRAHEFNTALYEELDLA